MSPSDIRKAITRKPFMPFVVHTTAGQEFAVSHPEAIWQAPEPDEETIIIHFRGIGIVFTDAAGISDVVFAGKRSAPAGQ